MAILSDHPRYSGGSATVYITTNTLKRFERGLIAVLMLALALVSLTACERVATVVSQVVVDQGAEASEVAFRGRVVGVTDGDTITVLDEQNQQHRVRLAEIDAPERGQPWGDRSKQALSVLVFGKSVSVQQTDTDRYGRVVARVFSDGDNINRAMVRDGHAWAYRQYLTDETLIATEARARRERAGLWSMSDAQTVAPWLWRRGERVGTGDTGELASAARPQALVSPAPRSADASASNQFSCSGKRYCREMSSCAEAHYYLRQCGVSSLDGNSDGEPCEALCGTMSR